MENRVREFDGLRGIAVVLVIAFHVFKRAAYFTEHPILTTISDITSVGWVGVDIFFTLSGYLITSILLKAKQGEHYFKNFYIRRVLRIFPLYYAAIAIVLLFVPKVEPEFTKNLGKMLPLMLLYQQNWAPLIKGLYISQYLGITWSLAIEEQFYLIWPFVVYKLNREQLVKVSIGYIIFSIIIRILGTIFWPDLDQASTFFYHSTFARFEEIVFGGLLAVFMTYDGAQQKVYRFSMGVFTLFFSIFIALCLLSLPGLPNPGYSSIPLMLGGYTSIALFSVGLIGIFITHPPQSFLRRFFQNPILAFFGKYSYSMYLFHMTAALILLDVYWHTGMRGWKPYILYIVSTYLATTLIALLTWNLLEKHMLNLKRFFEYKKSPSQSE
jgi:peptidoglycan/LPS O-acetylase OafA/YrhL